MPTQKPSVLIAASEREADRISSLVKEQCDPHILTPPDADCLLERIGSIGAEAVFIDSDLRDFDWPSAVYRICRWKSSISTAWPILPNWR